jgi:hypothetical protein
MKTKDTPVKSDGKKDPRDIGASQRHDELRSEGPLAEKDEVKQAERRLNKSIRQHL